MAGGRIWPVGGTSLSQIEGAIIPLFLKEGLGELLNCIPPSFHREKGVRGLSWKESAT